MGALGLRFIAVHYNSSSGPSSITLKDPQPATQPLISWPNLWGHGITRRQLTIMLTTTITALSADQWLNNHVVIKQVFRAGFTIMDLLSQLGPHCWLFFWLLHTLPMFQCVCVCCGHGLQTCAWLSSTPVDNQLISSQYKNLGSCPPPVFSSFSLLGCPPLCCSALYSLCCWLMSFAHLLLTVFPLLLSLLLSSPLLSTSDSDLSRPAPLPSHLHHLLP